MEFCDGRERHALPYAKYRTIPGWNFTSHTNPKTPTAHCLESRSDCQRWMGEPSSWAIPGLRTSGTVKDYVNWTDTIQPSNYSSDNQLSPQELATYAGQGRSFEIQRALSERYREKEKLLQRGELTNKWQSCSSTLRREKEKLSANSYRELEAWANRQYHSLPRKRCLEGGTWSALQCIPIRERMSGSAGRLVNVEPNYRHLANTSAPNNQENLNFDNRLKIQLETLKKQQPPQYITAKQNISWKTSDSNFKQNTVISTSFSHPPNYIPPPPYSTSEDKAETMKYTSHNSMFSTLRRQHTNHSSSDEIPRPATYLDADKARQQQKALKTLTVSLPVQQATQEQDAVPPQLQSLLQQYPEKGQMSYSDITPAKTSKLKKRGGETVFCLVSRMGELAGLSSSPDEPLKSYALPLLKVSTARSTAGISEEANVTNSCEKQRESQPVQVADEIDSGDVTKLQCGPLMTIKAGNILGESQTHTADQRNQKVNHKEESHIQEKLLTQDTGKRSFLNLTKKKDVDPNTGVTNKEEENVSDKTESLVAPLNQTTVKFPLWKEPKWHCSSGGALKKKKQSSNVSQFEQAVEGQPKHLQVNNNSNANRDTNRGLVVIDATCVVVKVEFIFPPEKEHVQYVCSRSCDSYEHSSESLNLQVQNNDHNHTDTPGPKNKCPFINNTQEIHLPIQEQHNSNLMNRCLLHSMSDTVPKDTSQMSNDKMPDDVIFEKETFQERAERILGITLKKSNSEGQIQAKLSQITQKEKSNLHEIQGSHCSVSEGPAKANNFKDSENQQKEVATSENAKTPRKKNETTLKEKEAHNSTINADSILEASKVCLIDAVKTFKAYGTMAMAIKEENKSTAEVSNATLDTTKHTTVSIDTVRNTTKQLKDNSDGKVNESPSDKLKDINNLLAPLLEIYIENTKELFDEEDTSSVSEKRDDMSLYSTVLGRYREKTSKLFDQESTYRDVVQNFCPRLLSASVEEKFESFAVEGCPKEDDLPCKTDYVNNLCPTLLADFTNDIDTSEAFDGSFSKGNLSDDMQTVCSTLFEDYVENSSEYFGQESSSNEARSLCKTDDVNNVCPVLPSSYIENRKEPFCEKDHSKENKLLSTMDDVNNLCPPLLESYTENTSELLGQEDTPNHSNKSDDISLCSFVLVENTSKLIGQESANTDDTQNMCSNVENNNEPCGKEDVPNEGNLSHETDGIEDLCLTFLNNTFRDNNCQLLDQESEPGEDTPLSATGDVKNLSPLLGINVENTELSFDQKYNEFTSPLTYVYTVSTKESTFKSPLACLAESPNHLDFTQSSDIHVNQESLSPSGVPSTLPSPPLTPVLLAHSRGTESLSQTRIIHDDICFFNLSTPPKSIKKKHYPKSLWDAVNRIRKHTAPDSENEEEEGVELWEQMENTSVEVEPQKSVLEKKSAYDENYLADVFITPDTVDAITNESISADGEGSCSEESKTVEKVKEVLRVESKDVDQTENDTPG